MNKTIIDRPLSAQEYIEDCEYKRDAKAARIQAGIAIVAALVMGVVLVMSPLNAHAGDYWSKCRSVRTGEIMIVEGRSCPRGFVWAGWA